MPIHTLSSFVYWSLDFSEFESWTKSLWKLWMKGGLRSGGLFPCDPEAFIFVQGAFFFFFPHGVSAASSLARLSLTICFLPEKSSSALKGQSLEWLMLLPGLPHPQVPRAWFLSSSIQVVFCPNGHGSSEVLRDPLFPQHLHLTKVLLLSCSPAKGKGWKDCLDWGHILKIIPSLFPSCLAPILPDLETWQSTFSPCWGRLWRFLNCKQNQTSSQAKDFCQKSSWGYMCLVQEFSGWFGGNMKLATGLKTYICLSEAEGWGYIWWYPRHGKGQRPWRGFPQRSTDSLREICWGFL